MQQADSVRLEAALAIVRQATDRLASLSELHSPGGGSAALCAVADKLYSDRRRRDQQFPPGLFGEPAWDLLLAMYVAREDGRELGLAEAYAAAKVDPREGPALIDKLVTTGMVLRTRAANNGQREAVALTDQAVDLLSDYLADMI